MASSIHLAALVPLIAGLAVHYAVSSRDRAEAHVRDEALGAARVYAYPSSTTWLLFIFASVTPAVFFSLPDSVVGDAKLDFRLLAIAFGVMLWGGWFYCLRYKIVLGKDYLQYGAIRRIRVPLSAVTRITYHRVNNGILLRLYSAGGRLCSFRGGIAGFDDFAKSLRRKLPSEVAEETVGKASFS